MAPKSVETTFTLLKYTNLHGIRQEHTPNLGQLYVAVNKSRRFVSVIMGTKTLVEFSLISVPLPIVKTRDQDVFFNTFDGNGSTVSKFRIKFLSASDHASFVELISHFAKPNASVGDYGNISSTQFSQNSIAGEAEYSNSTFSTQSSLSSQLPLSQMSLSQSSNKSVRFLSPVPSLKKLPVTTAIDVDRKGFSQDSVSNFLVDQRKRRNDGSIYLSQPTKLFCEGNGEKELFEKESRLGSSQPTFFRTVRDDFAPPSVCSDSVSDLASKDSFSISGSSLNISHPTLPSDQLVPSSLDSASVVASQSSGSDFCFTQANSRQVSARQVSVMDVETQTEALLSLDELLKDDYLLKKVIASRLEDPKFMEFVAKCTDVCDMIMPVSRDMKTSIILGSFCAQSLQDDKKGVLCSKALQYAFKK